MIVRLARLPPKSSRLTHRTRNLWQQGYTGQICLAFQPQCLSWRILQLQSLIPSIDRSNRPRSYATAAHAHVVDDAPDYAIPFVHDEPPDFRKSEELHPTSIFDLLIAPQSSFEPPNPERPLVLEPPKISSGRSKSKKSLGSPDSAAVELHLILDACLSLRQYDRATTLLKKLASTYESHAPALLQAHNQYLQSLLFREIESPDGDEASDESQRASGEQCSPPRTKRGRQAPLSSYTMALRWFQSEMLGKGVPPHSSSLAIMLKLALQLDDDDAMNKAVNECMTIARKHKLSTDDLDEEDLLSDEELSDLMLLHADQLAPVYNRSDQETLSSPVSIELPVIQPVAMKGLGLKTLQRSMGVLSDFSDVDGRSLPIDSEAYRLHQQARQVRLERDAVEAAIHRWHQEASHMSDIGISPALQRKSIGTILWRWHRSFLESLRTEKSRRETRNMNKSRLTTVSDDVLVLSLLQMLPLETLSGAVILRVLYAIASRPDPSGFPLLALASKIGASLHDELVIKMSAPPSGGSDRRAKSQKQLYKSRISSLSNASSEDLVYLSQFASAKLTPLTSVRQIQWSTSLKARLGVTFLQLLMPVATISVTREDPLTRTPITIEQQALMRVSTAAVGRHVVGMITPHPEFEELLTRQEVPETVAKHLPMIAEPIKWRAIDRGCLYVSPVQVMRSKGDSEQQQYLAAAAARDDLKSIFAGLDVLNRTPWRINRPILKVMIEAWNTGEEVAKIAPLHFKPEYPPNPGEDAPYPERKKYSEAVRAIDGRTMGYHSERCYQNFQLEIAKAFQDERFYLPHNIDFRGRAYPIPPYLNHMNADNCRGILIFAKGKTLGPSGLRALRIHLANLYGYDKASFKEREEFAMKHLPEIYDSVDNPLIGKRWWLKAGDPWQCLAACFELKNALESPDPTQFVSHLTVHTDGTCNGLQHYAALGGDSIGARQVNLEPGDRPADIYSAVAEQVQEAVRADAEAGDPIAQLLDGKVTRKVVKQTVMTNVYGVTFIGARNQVRKQLEVIFNPRPVNVNVNQLAVYVARNIFKALGSMFSGAQDIQHWLSECAELISMSVGQAQLDHADIQLRADQPGVVKSSDEPALDVFQSSVVWTTPLRLPVVQPYRKPSTKVIKTGMQKLSILETNRTSPVSKRNQRQAFPPNYIHSLDATHMLVSALKCDEAGLAFAAVHDSFWTHACDLDTMNRILRDAFIKIHSEDLVGNLATEFKYRYQNHYMAIDMDIPLAPRTEVTQWRRANRRRLKVQLAEPAIERQRRELLNSDDPAKQEQGRQMETPVSICEKYGVKPYHRKGSNRIKARGESSIDKPTTNSSAPAADEEKDTEQGSEFALEGGESEDVVEQDTLGSGAEFDLAAPDPDDAGDGAVDSDQDVESQEEEGEEGTEEEEEEGTEEEEEEEEETASKFKSKSKAKRRPATVKPEAEKLFAVRLWAPVNFPPVPKKGEFDVSRLKNSEYFFS